MTQELREEFERYLEEISADTESFALPDYLSDCQIIACMQDNPQKKTFLLKNKSGRKILFKYAAGEFQMMLKTENEVTDSSDFTFLPYVIDYRETKDSSVLLREYIDGRTLKELVAEEGPLRLSDALPIIHNVCYCLMRLHDAEPALIHRDIKPSNIVLTKSGDCYLVDMGTLRRYHEGNSSDTLCMGTADFAAPEQFGARQTDVRTDIYGLGMLFYYLLTGKSQLQESFFADIPHRVAAIIRKCTAFDPNDRYENIHQVQRALHRLNITKKPAYSQIVACASTILSLVLLALLIIPRLGTGHKQVVFSSPLLERAVKQELGKSDNEAVYQDELQKITSLKICGNVIMQAESEHNYRQLPLHTVDGSLTQYGNISDISLLAQMPNLAQLILDEQEITDITPLRGLPLVSVSLFGNPISDLSPLADCDTLYELDISYTKVQTLDPLTDCSELQILYCISTPVKSIAPLANSKLEQLCMLDTIIDDYTPLISVPLLHLECSHISEESLEDIKKISSLIELHMYHSTFPTLQAFDGLERITFLSVGYDNLESLTGIEHLPRLKHLNLTHNPLSECPPLPALRILMVDSTGVRDFAFINEMPVLEELTISEEQLPYLTEAVPNPWFEIRFN